jgi:hypothetical protein
MGRFHGRRKAFSPRTNVGTFEGDGFEYEIVSAIHPKVSLWTNGALSGNDFTVPKFNANFGADVMILPGFSINPTLRYMTRQVMAAPVDVLAKTSAGEDTSIVEFNYGYANNRMYLDLAVSYEGLKIPATGLEMDLRGVAKNLLDNTELVGTRWMADSYHPQGMTWELGLAVRF